MPDRAVNDRLGERPGPGPDPDPGPGATDQPGGDGVDFRGSRRLVGFEEWFWYLLAAVTYIVLGIWHKWLLNWFVGPAWLVGFVVLGPWLTDRLGITGRRGDRS